MWLRRPGTNSRGSGFDQKTVQSVWDKAAIVPGFDPALYRKDACGAWIAWSEYGNQHNLGWEIDHTIPVAMGGKDTIDNLQVLQWRNNRIKADHWPNWYCAIQAA
jgi:5-methylcytosine-specific restriction endonuclease McrA